LAEALLEERARAEPEDEDRRGHREPAAARRASAGRAATAGPEHGGPETPDVGEVLADAAQVAREVARRGVALFRVLLQAALDEPAERRRERSR
jgi:hypothetical protein